MHKIQLSLMMTAILDIKSLVKGLLVPRMTTAQRLAIASPANGLLVYDTDIKSFFFYQTGNWTQLANSQIWDKNNNYIYLSDPMNNVGIGVSNTENKLLVKTDATTGLDESIFAVFNTNGDTVFAVYNQGVRIWVNDYLGVGTYPGYHLNVAGSANLNNGLTGVAMYCNGDEAIWYNDTYFSWGYGGYWNYFADKVGIGDTDPYYKLELPNNSNVTLGCGRAYVWNTYSDARVKFNPEKLKYGIDEIMMLVSKKYDYHTSDFDKNGLIINDDYSTTIGLFAQDVYKIIPEDESKGLWSLDYEKLIPVLISAMQDQQKTIERQQKKIDELESVVNKLKINNK